jgi:hypothetical protein
VVYEQWCPCQRSTAHQAAWPGWDFNTYVELCRCCCLEPIKSGSRWSVFFCSECKDRVVALNDEIGESIPIGRHSLMHGIVGTVDDELDAAEELVRAFQILDQAIERLDEHAKEQTQTNIRTLGFAPGEDVLLDSYLERGAVSDLTKADAFGNLRTHFLR